MEVLGWLWWLLLKLVGLVWTVVWFLLGGWVSTLAQIGVIALLIYGYKYGWRQAPQEILSRAARFGRLGWTWVRNREVPASAWVEGRDRKAERQAGRQGNRRATGDVNISTLLNILMLAGLAVAVLV